MLLRSVIAAEFAPKAHAAAAGAAGVRKTLRFKTVFLPLLQSMPNEDNKYAEDRTHPKAY